MRWELERGEWAPRCERAKRLARWVAGMVVFAGLAACATPALAVFPIYGAGKAGEPATWRFKPGETLTNLGTDLIANFGATPQAPSAEEPAEAPQIEKVNSQEDELCGVTGMAVTDAEASVPSGTGSCIAAGTPVHTAMQITLGRPDVTIAETDSGIEWNNAGAMKALRAKVLLNVAELPAPQVDMTKTFDPSTGVDCETARAATGGDYDADGAMPGGTPGGRGPIPYDVLEQGVFNVLDYACDSRVANVVENYPQCTNPPTTSKCRNGPPGMLTPEDLIIAFSDGVDHDKNGYVNDIAGWNFVDNDNDPYDEVHFAHGTQEEEESSAEADNGINRGGDCSNCMIMELRTGESFITDANRWAEAAVYAVDRGVDVIQEPLGTYNAPQYAREAIDYAYDHGTTVIASAADEAAEHHNQPAALPNTIVVNAIRGPSTVIGSGSASLNTKTPPSWLQLSGCTNYGPRVVVSVPSDGCSSGATGYGSGVVGLIYSAALNACGAGLYGPCSRSGSPKLKASSDCKRVNGEACVITPNEVRQLLASGNIEGTTVNGPEQLGSKAPSSGKASADEGEGGQADDVDTAAEPETACSVGMAPNCTDPNLNTIFAANENGGTVGSFPDTFKYPTRKGFDEFTGYGRVDAYKAVNAAAEGWIPPEVNITSPEWFQQINPGEESFALDGYVDARTGYTCKIEVAPGADPDDALTSAGGDFATVPSAYCDGTTVHSRAYNGLLANVSTKALEEMFPEGDPESFSANMNGGAGLKQSENGRPNTQPYAFTVRVVATTAPGAHGPVMTGEDRRQMNLHRDSQMLAGFPLETKSDGDSSPLLVDLAGNDENQLVLANSEGWIHAYQYDPTSGALVDLPGWPVHTEALPLHTGEHAYSSGALSTPRYAGVLGGLAAGDLSGDGEMDIVADDLEGNVYAWNAKGKLIFHETSDPDYSGAPLPGDPGWEAQRAGHRERTQRGFVTAPVLADLEPEKGAGLDIIVAGEDRHVYAWHPDGEAVTGFPVLVEDPDKVGSVDPTSNEPRFNSNVPRSEGEDQGKIVDTPAVANLDGPGKPPSIIVGTNEEYQSGSGDEGPTNASPAATSSAVLLSEAGILGSANSRLYAIKASGCSSEPSSCATGGFKCEDEKCSSVAFREGWPVKIGLLEEGAFPEVGEGVTGSPIVAPIDCPEGGEGLKIGVTPDFGLGYVLNANGSSCYGSVEGKYNALQTDFSASSTKTDTPAFPIVGEPAFGTLNGTTTTMFAPVAGVLRIVDLDPDIPNTHKGGQDFLGAWNANTGQFSPGFPAVDDDLAFLTGETIGDITGEEPKQEVVGGTASLDLEAFNEQGLPASSAWPKLTGGWTVATPTLGSLGTIDTSSEAKKDVVSITREGVVAVYGTPAKACSPSSWPNFHHDIANSGDYERDAVPPGHPMNASVAEGTLSWTAPGNEGMCGAAVKYEVVTSDDPITPENFASATPISGAPAPAAAGTAQSFKLPADTLAYVAIRAVGEQENIGLPAVAEYNSGAPLPAIGRCLRAAHGEWAGRHCEVERHGKGKTDFYTGPGPKPKISGTLGPATLETVAGSKITCAGGSSSGEYIAGGRESLTLKLTGCARAGESCQDVGASAGEITSAALEGEAGFISGKGTKKPIAGLDFKAKEGAILTAECGTALSKALVTVEGSVIGPVSKTNVMTFEQTIELSARGGHQAPEAFEEGLKDTLLENLTNVSKGERTSEQAGLTVTAKDHNEEKMEIKTRVL